MLSWIRIPLLTSALLLLAGAQGQPDEPNNTREPGIIYANTGNTTEGRPLQKNIETVIKFFYQNNPPNGFATSLGYGDFPNTAYGHSACYNMSDQTDCASCIQQVYSTIQRTYPLTVGAFYWMNDTGNRCRLRFEAYNFTKDILLLGVLGPNVSAPPPPMTVINSPPGSATLPAPPSHKRSILGTAAILGVVLGGLFFLIIPLAFFILRWRRMYTKRRRHGYQGRTELETSIEGPVVFKYQDLSVATSNFSERNKLGGGGFGIVYKAILSDGTQVAVKKLTLESHQGRREFVNEINIITAIQHRNLVRLKGYCVEGDERLLVYELLEKGSLDQALFGSRSYIALNWKVRFQIAIGVARGLAYLHEESHVQVIHRDIKASNILLDEKLQPKISDFGISKLFDMDKGFTSTKVAGTFGYMAPEYVTRGRLTSKTDVFSYGVLALEIVSGRKCVDSTLPPEQELLVPLTWNHCEAGKIESCVDQKLGENYVIEEARRLIHVAILCTQGDEESRPVMSDVVAMLLGYLEIGRLSSQAPVYFARAHFKQESSTASSTTATTDSGNSITDLEAR